MEMLIMAAKRGLYANIHAKRKRIAAGSGEKMRKPGLKEHPRLLTSNAPLKLLKRKSNLLIMKSIIASGLLLGWHTVPLLPVPT